MFSAHRHRPRRHPLRPVRRGAHGARSDVGRGPVAGCAGGGARTGGRGGGGCGRGGQGGGVHGGEVEDGDGGDGGEEEGGGYGFGALFGRWAVEVGY